MISLIQGKIPLCVKDGGLVEVGIEACPNEIIEALKKVGQVCWGRFGLLGLHALRAGRQTRRRRRCAGGRCDPQVARKVCVRLNQLVYPHHVIYAYCFYALSSSLSTYTTLMSVSITLRLWLCKYIRQRQTFTHSPIETYLAQLGLHRQSAVTKQQPRMQT